MNGKKSHAILPLYTRFGIGHFDVSKSEKRPARPFPDLTKMSEIILHTLKIAGGVDKSKAVIAKELLDSWSVFIDSEAESLKKLYEEGLSFLASDGLTNSNAREVMGQFPVLWDDSRIWKSVRMLMMVDDMIYRLARAQKTEFISMGDMKKKQRAIAAPLRRVFSEVVRSSKLLFISVDVA